MNKLETRPPLPLPIRLVRAIVAASFLFTAVAFAWSLFDRERPRFATEAELEQRIVELKGELAESLIREEKLRARIEELKQER